MISPREIQKGSILSYDGKPQVVKNISDYICFEGYKEWVGGSLINGEPISEVWLERLGFQNHKGESLWTNHKITIDFHEGKFTFGGSLRVYEYVHHLQILQFAITGEYLTIPKLK